MTAPVHDTEQDGEPCETGGPDGSGSGGDGSDLPPPSPEGRVADPDHLPGRGGVLGAVWQVVVQTVGFIRKETLEVLRQPRLLLVMVVGPFLVLALFAVGFDQQNTVLSTVFVGPPDGPYESSVEEFADDLRRYVDSAGYTSDLVGARNDLADGEIDLIVIFPEDPAESVLAGERATISVLHDKIDPIQQTTVEVSAQVAVQELNATILERVVGGAQTELVKYEDSISEASTLVDRFAEARESGDLDAMRSTADELDRNGGDLDQVVTTSDSIVTAFGGEDGRGEELDDLVGLIEEYRTSVDQLAELGEDASPSEIERVRSALSAIDERGGEVTTLDPAVLVRPFTGETESFQRESISIQSFFAPAAIALLLQHMVLTFAAMSLVSDRSLGLFELYRVGPIRSGRILLGKAVAFLLIGAAAAAVLLAAVRFGLGIPFRGGVEWVALTIVGLVVSSIALGMLISMVAKSDTQAVQYALLALLAGLFFSGFFLDLDAFRYPFKAIAWTMPVTYGVRLLRDVMLRGTDPAVIDLVGLITLTVVYGGLSWVLFSRRLRVR
ncbi:ABC transporter permease [Ilumatobacter sp.]|uniref:ABC transporter permease n=1 Tax=Ilumatobacter sp. TaxID=1967498 RepID=UPI003B5237DB